MDASSGSMEKEGIVLLGDLWSTIKQMNKMQDYHKECKENSYFKPHKPRMPKSEEVLEIMTRTAHRLAFLEMVTKGLAYMEQHDAQAYAKFVEKKRKIEDLDLDELRVLLR